MPKLSKNAENYAKELGLDLKDISKQTGLSVATVRKALKRDDVSQKTIDALVAVLGESVLDVDRDHPLYTVILLKEAESAGGKYYAKDFKNSTLIGIDHPNHGFVVRSTTSLEKKKIATERIRKFNSERLD